jgi:hypothetical protein
MRDILIVSDEKMASFLTKMEHLTYIQAFLGQENSVKAAAEQASVKPNQMLYYVRKMHSVGLLRVTRTSNKRGKEIRYYRCIANEFFVPMQYTPFENLEAFFRAVSNLMLDKQVYSQATAIMQNNRHESYGFWMGFAPGSEDLRFRLSRKEDMGLSNDDANAEATHLPQLASLPVAMVCRRIRLSREKGEWLRQQLLAMASLPEENEGDYYIVRMALAPELE